MQDREFYDGDLVPGTRYRVTSLLGHGGMGSVYEVEHVELGRRFVLKALMRELARRQDLVQRLRNEWRALGRLEHPNIVSVTDAGTTPTGVPYYVMERLEGETLGACLRRVRRLTVPEALEIAAGVLDGLSAAHAIGVTHRDVKPANIFLLSDARPKVLDFGVAKITDAVNVVTARGVAVGTPRYMSPEQARGTDVDGRSDVYAVGLLLFEMISGAGPFDDARDANEMLLAHLAREAPRLRGVAKGVSIELDETVASMLAKDSCQRPDSARTLAGRLRAIAAGYSTRISTTDLTPAAGYAATTAQLQHDPSRRELATRAEGAVANASTQGTSTPATAVEAPPSWERGGPPSSGELPTVALAGDALRSDRPVVVPVQNLPSPPAAHAESARRSLPATTLVEPTPAGLVGPAGRLTLPSPVPAVTARLGTGELRRDQRPSAIDVAERRVPEAASSAYETRTRVPMAEPSPMVSPVRVVPSSGEPSPAWRGRIGAVAIALIAVGAFVGLLAIPASHEMPAVPATGASAAPPREPLTTESAPGPSSLPQAALPGSVAVLPMHEASAATPRPPVSPPRFRKAAPAREKTAEKTLPPASPPESPLPASGL